MSAFKLVRSRLFRVFLYPRTDLEKVEVEDESIAQLS